MLAEAGFKVAEASNGMSALRMALEAQPQIVVICRGLPEISAADVIGSLHSDHRMRHSAVVQVENPCNAIELLATVVSALEARHTERQAEVAVPMRSVKAAAWGKWPLVDASISRATSRMRKAGRSGYVRFSSGIETL
jgi:DNA-binding NarL/FixJ family response regulator